MCTCDAIPLVIKEIEHYITNIALLPSGWDERQPMEQMNVSLKALETATDQNIDSSYFNFASCMDLW